MSEKFTACPDYYIGIRFDEGGADSLPIIITFINNNVSRLSGSTLRGHIKKHRTAWITVNYVRID